MEKPLLSVIVPVYKVEKFLPRCLRSLVSQTYENLEILLVDDGSPDGSGAICDAWAEKDRRIRVIHQKNAGAGAARNAALDAAGGELIGFVDSDDYIAPDFYDYLYSLMDENVDIAECGYLETRDDDAEFHKEPGDTFRYTPQEAMAEHIRDRVFRQLIWNKLYRRNVVENLRFPVDTWIDDEFFTYRALGKAAGLVRSDRILYAYRQQDDSIMHRPFSLKRLNGLRAKQQRMSFLEEKMPELVPLAKRDLLMSCLYAMQGTLRNLTGEDREQAFAFLRETVAALKPLPKDPEAGGKRRLLMASAARSLRTTAAAVNLLEDMHILK